MTMTMSGAGTTPPSQAWSYQNLARARNFPTKRVLDIVEELVRIPVLTAFQVLPHLKVSGKV
jgi:hypothetical protein